jgi:predicted nuclease of restriction endonuclease-like (RecB) superfamily
LSQKLSGEYNYVIYKREDVIKMPKEIMNGEYKHFLTEIKSNINSSRISAAKKINYEQITLYMKIGGLITKNQEKNDWGKAIVEKLSRDLKKEFPSRSGFSARNLWDMRRFYLEYKDNPILRQLVAEIPWGHNLLIMNKIKDEKEKEYYIKNTIENGWTRNVLNLQIKSNAYQRQVLSTKTHNFNETLPKVMAEQADKTLKDVYMLDFLGITEPVLEREIENKMLEKVKETILELGYGFAFMGNQYKVSTETKDYFIDLLFYHRKLKCLVAFELKIGEFKAEYAGKMNLYLNLLDDKVRQPDEKNSIGIVLCAEKDSFEVEYALRGMEKPIGVAEYKLTRELPSELKGALPSREELEKEIL